MIGYVISPFDKVCGNCNDTEQFHPLNGCRNFNMKTKTTVVRVPTKTWTSYFKSFFFKQPEFVDKEIEEPCYYKNPQPFDESASLQSAYIPTIPPNSEDTLLHKTTETSKFNIIKCTWKHVCNVLDIHKYKIVYPLVLLAYSKDNADGYICSLMGLFSYFVYQEKITEIKKITAKVNSDNVSILKSLGEMTKTIDCLKCDLLQTSTETLRIITQNKNTCEVESHNLDAEGFSYIPKDSKATVLSTQDPKPTVLSTKDIHLSNSWKQRVLRTIYL